MLHAASEGSDSRDLPPSRPRAPFRGFGERRFPSQPLPVLSRPTSPGFLIVPEQISPCREWHSGSNLTSSGMCYPPYFASTLTGGGAQLFPESWVWVELRKFYDRLVVSSDFGNEWTETLPLSEVWGCKCILFSSCVKIGLNKRTYPTK